MQRETPLDKNVPGYAQYAHQPIFNKGNSLLRLRRCEEAVRAYDVVLRLNPEAADAYHWKGEALSNLKHHEEALAAYEQAIRLDPTFSWAYYGKGSSLSNLKRYEEANLAFEKASQLGFRS
jgi:tetratricopeptide (TPR) repeat protein